MKEFLKIRPLFFGCVVATCIAIICSFLNSTAILALCGALIFGLIFAASSKYALKCAVVCAFVISILVAVSTGLYTYFVYDKVLQYADKEVTLECEIVSEVVNENDKCTATVRVLEIHDGDETKRANFKAFLTFADNFHAMPSSRIKADVAFWGNDYIDRFGENGVHISGLANNAVVTGLENKYSLQYIYHSVRTRIKSILPITDTESAAFLKGMIFGDKTDISGRFSRTFTKIGMSHVLSVSGMHLVFAVMFFEMFMVLFGIGYRPRAYAALVAIVLFTFVSGFAVSCIRAGIMLSFYYIARLIDRFEDSLTSLSVSVILILLFSPYNVRSISFVLSACASFGLIVITPFLNKRVKITTSNRFLKNFLKAVVGTVNVSLGANIACLPVFIFIFKDVSLISPITNLLLTLPIQILFYIGFLSVFLSFVPFSSAIFTALANVVYDFVAKLSEWCYNLKYTSVNVGYEYFYLVFALFAALLIGIFVYSYKFPERKLYPYILSYVGFCLVMFGINYVTYHDTVKVDFADVGQGSCAVISQSETGVVVDCGGTDYLGMAESLDRSTVKRLELVALTHTDSDHVNFLGDLVEFFEIERIVYPKFSDITDIGYILDIARENGAEVTAVGKDECIEVLNGAELSLFVEKAYNSKIDNNTSAVYKLNYGDTSVLFTGDMDVNQEHAYLKYGDSLDCDILSVAHHGARRSSLAKALEQYSPEYSVISVGKDNGYGMPHSMTLERLEKVSKVLRTDELSTVTFILKEKGYKLKLR